MFLFLALFALALFAVEDVVKILTEFLIVDIGESVFFHAASIRVHNQRPIFSETK